MPGRMEQRRDDLADKIYDLAVIGGGASGIMAAISAAREGADVIIIDHADTLGKKILATGNGRCNFTNKDQDPRNYHSSSPGFVEGALRRFGRDELIGFFEGIGLFVKEKGGYYYPFSESASDVRDVLLLEAERLAVETVLSVKVLSVKKREDIFFLSTEPPGGKINIGDEDAICARNIVIATGGRAAKKLGSDGLGYRMAKSLGHSVTPLFPALVPLEADGDFAAVSGVRTDARLTLFIDGAEADTDMGQLQMTDYGISGIPVFQISAAAARALYEGRDVRVRLDFMPLISVEKLILNITRRLEDNLSMRISDALAGMLQRKLINFLLGSLGISKKTKCMKLSDNTAGDIARRMKEYEVTITNTLSFDRSQTTAGGIPLDEVDEESFESLKCPGLYLCGEILDVDGRCGGYNLQWAFTSGYLAGKGSRG